MLDRIERDGYAWLEESLEAELVESWGRELDGVLRLRPEGTLASRRSIYGARNLPDLWPRSDEIARHPLLREVVGAVLGPTAGLVRTLYFDKPPTRSWSLPLHQDLAIAVREGRAVGDFTRPTVKARVPHLEAPRPVLERMLTLRVHLDPMNGENGPLQVIPASHRHVGEEPKLEEAIELYAEPGAVLAMRPLLWHGSRSSLARTSLRRRVLHFEYAVDSELPHGLAWHRFLALEG